MPAPVLYFHAAAQAIGRTHGNGTNDAITELLLYFEGQAVFCHAVSFSGIQLEGIVNLRHSVAREVDVHHGADALND
jgi:hypothetical protein